MFLAPRNPDPSQRASPPSSSTQRRYSLAANVVQVWNRRQEDAEKLIETWEALHECFDDEFAEGSCPLEAWFRHKLCRGDEVYEDIHKEIIRLRDEQLSELGPYLSKRVLRFAERWNVRAHEIVESFGFASISERFIKQLGIISPSLTLPEAKVRLCRIRQARLLRQSETPMIRRRDPGRYTPRDVEQLKQELRSRGLRNDGGNSGPARPKQPLDIWAQQRSTLGGEPPSRVVQDSQGTATGERHLAWLSTPEAPLGNTILPPGPSPQLQPAYDDKDAALSPSLAGTEVYRYRSVESQDQLSSLPQLARDSSPMVEDKYSSVVISSTHKSEDPQSYQLQLKPDMWERSRKRKTRTAARYARTRKPAPEYRDTQGRAFSKGEQLDETQVSDIEVGRCADASVRFSSPSIDSRTDNAPITSAEYVNCTTTLRHSIEPVSDYSQPAYDSGAIPSAESTRAFSSLVPPHAPSLLAIPKTTVSYERLAPISISSLGQGELVDDNAIISSITLFTSENFKVIDPLLLNDQFPTKDLDSPWIGGDARFWILPVHHSTANHWTLGVVDRDTGRILHYDSLSRLGCFPDFTRIVTAVLGSTRYALRGSEWEFCSMECPSQSNNYDCGIYCIANAIYYMAGCRCNIPCEEWRDALASLLSSRYYRTKDPSQAKDSTVIADIDLRYKAQMELLSRLENGSNTLSHVISSLKDARNAEIARQNKYAQELQEKLVDIAGLFSRWKELGAFLVEFRGQTRPVNTISSCPITEMELAYKEALAEAKERVTYLESSNIVNTISERKSEMDTRAQEIRARVEEVSKNLVVIAQML